jgi:hypothetical protein
MCELQAVRMVRLKLHHGHDLIRGLLLLASSLYDSTAVARLMDEYFARLVC